MTQVDRPKLGVAPDGGLTAELERRIVQSLNSEGPSTDPDLAVTAFGDATSQPVRYYVYADVLEELVKAARYRQESATAILMGQFCIDETGPFIEVTAFRDLEYLYGGDALEMTEPLITDVYEELSAEADSDGNHVVGIFAARPKKEATFDRELARLHLSLFNMPYQMALVVDGVADRLAVYARRPRGPFFNAAFSLVERGEKVNETELAQSPAVDEPDFNE